jgi:hypothetical protein
MTDAEDPPYVVVRRTINGETVRYIERLHSRNFADVRDCFFVDSGLSYDAPVAITGITAADPVVVTAPAHGFSDGDEVDLSDIVWVSDFDDMDNETQPDQLNLGRYTVANAATNTFELADEDGSAFSAYVSGGYARKAVLSISGFHHLAGETDVIALADGNVVTGLEVSALGVITFERKFSRVHAGLKYICDLETLPPEAPRGTIQGAEQKISELTLRFLKSGGVIIGYDNDHLYEIKQRQYEVMGDPTALFTGDKTVTLSPQWKNEGSVFLRQRYPLPVTLLAVVPEIEVGD